VTSIRLAASGALAIATLVGGGVRAQGAERTEAERLLRENQILRRQSELAAGEAFYLLLDTSGRTLKFMLRGVVLYRYDVAAVELARPQVAFVDRGSDLPWQGRIWTNGNLVPPRERDRIEIKVPPPGQEDEAPPVIPPLPEEAVPVPSRYGVRFTGGLFVEVDPEGGNEPGLGERFQHWWDDVREALRSEPTDRIRLRLRLKSEDAQSIYRSLPPDCALLVL
jgi:hypothetical protein